MMMDAPRTGYCCHCASSQATGEKNQSERLLEEPSELPYNSRVGIGLLLLAAVILVLWLVPKWQVAGSIDESRFTRENEARKVLAEIVGGTLLLAGLWTSVENLKVSQQTLLSSQQGQRTEVMAKAVDRLSHTDEFTRMGAVVILGQLAEQSTNDRKQVLKLLHAYLLARSPSELSADRTLGLVKPSSSDMAAAIQLLVGPIFGSNKSHRLNLSRIACHDVDLSGARLDGAYLWDTDMQRIHLDDASMVDADIRNSILWSIYGRNIDASESKFSATQISIDVSGLNLSRAKFLGCYIAVTSFNNANLSGTVFATTLLQDVDLSHADLRSANLAGTIPFDIDPQTGRKMKAEAHMPTKTVLAGVNFTRADLRGCDLRGIDLTQTKGLTREQIAVAITDNQTVLPNYLR